MPLIQRSKKTVKPLETFVASQVFIFPRSMSTDCQDGKNVIKVQINLKAYYIPTGEVTEIPYPAFCVLRDSGLDLSQYEIAKPFDPFI